MIDKANYFTTLSGIFFILERFLTFFFNKITPYLISKEGLINIYFFCFNSFKNFKARM